jgi:hypothetical protein
MEETLGQLGDLPGTVVVDVSYPYNKRGREALRASSTAAKDIVLAMARDMGFHPVDAGPLKATRDWKSSWA